MELDNNDDLPLMPPANAAPPDGAERTLVRDTVLDAEDREAEGKRRIKARDFAQRVLSRWHVMAEASKDQRKRSMDCVEFNAGKHWDSDMRAEREDKNRVVLEVNRTPQYLNQVSNAQRMTRPSILVKPNGNGADEGTASIKGGIVKSIERRGDAESIRDDAFYGMLEKGFSYYRVNVMFESEKSWRRVIRPGRFYSDFSVYHDPAACEPDLTDANDWVITDDMPIDEYERLYGSFDRASLDQMATTDDWIKEWIGDGVIRVAEYFYKEKVRTKLYSMADDSDGEGMWEDEVPRVDGEPVGVTRLENGEPVWRWDFKTRVMWAKVDASRVLEGNADLTEGREYIKPRNGVALKYIPIIPVLGQRRVVDKHVIYDGMVYDAIAPCLASDYWLSAITEMVALGPKSPWVVVYDAIAEYREMWDQSNIENYAALYYDKYDAEGNELPAPMRSFGEPPIQAMTFILNYAEEDIKRVMGIYQRSLGATGPEHSGVAINSVQREADVANYHYVDNLKRSQTLEARIYLNLMPIVYSDRQVAEIIRPDGKAEQVTINKMFKDSAGNDKEYKMSTGDYDAEVEIGWSTATKREAAVQGIMDYLKIDGEAAPLVGYLLARNMDFPDKSELEQILKGRAVKMGADVPEEDSDQQIPEQFKVQYKQVSDQLEQITKAFQALQDAVKTEQIKHGQQMQLKAMELASAERQASAKNSVDALKAELAAKSKADMVMIQTALDQVNQDVADFRKPGPVEYMFDEQSGQFAPMQQPQGAVA